ncbi:MAG TPA: oligosaccharide flippase family protein [Bryobacteraceae bacterium]|nr:oligosaccharide flippase family protein [Bryobacteraceae bacterium]
MSARRYGSDRGGRFVRNVLWNWLGTGVNLFIGFVLSPYLILKLGAAGYGLWAIAFSLVEYYWLFDLGFRSATVKFVAHYWARGEPERVAGVMSTALVYSAIAAALVMSAALALAGIAHRFFQVPPDLRGSFQTLLLLITLNWCLGLVFNTFNAALEAVQNFEYSTKASVAAAAARAVGWTVALHLGYKLIAIGIIAVASQAIGYAVNYVYYRRIFSGQRLSVRHVRFTTLREMAGFGIHTFVMTSSNQLLNQSAPVLIGHFLPVAFVGFYNLPVRLLQYTVEMVGRIGIVTNTNAAELAARHDPKTAATLAIYTNRYCLVLFMPLSILLWTYGPQLLTFWVGAQFASHSATALPALVTGYVIGIVGQFSAAMLLQGLGKHQSYARTLLVEAICAVLLLWIAIPRWGIAGAAWVTSALMIINRGLVTSWLASKTVGVPFFVYVRNVYARPLLAMAPAAGIALWLRSSVLPGGNLTQMIAAAAIISSAYYGLAFFVTLERDHRATLGEWIATSLKPVLADGATHA